MVCRRFVWFGTPLPTPSLAHVICIPRRWYGLYGLNLFSVISIVTRRLHVDNKNDIEDLFDPLLQFCNRFCSWAIPGPNQLVLPFTAACRQVQSELAPMSHVGQTGAGETGQTGPYVPGRVLTGVKPAKARTWQKPLPPGAAPRQAQAVFLRILGDYCLCYGPKGGCIDFLETVGALIFEWFWIFQRSRSSRRSAGVGTP